MKEHERVLIRPAEIKKETLFFLRTNPIHYDSPHPTLLPSEFQDGMVYWFNNKVSLRHTITSRSGAGERKRVTIDASCRRSCLSELIKILIKWFSHCLEAKTCSRFMRKHFLRLSNLRALLCKIFRYYVIFDTFSMNSWLGTKRSWPESAEGCLWYRILRGSWVFGKSRVSFSC